MRWIELDWNRGYAIDGWMEVKTYSRACCFIVSRVERCLKCFQIINRFIMGNARHSRSLKRKEESLAYNLESTRHIKRGEI